MSSEPSDLDRLAATVAALVDDINARNSAMHLDVAVKVLDGIGAVLVNLVGRNPDEQLHAIQQCWAVWDEFDSLYLEATRATQTDLDQLLDRRKEEPGE